MRWNDRPMMHPRSTRDMPAPQGRKAIARGVIQELTPPAVSCRPDGVSAPRIAVVAILALAIFPTIGLACPFCTAVGPTLSQRRESAEVVALGELVENGPAGRVFRLHKVAKGIE